jgi:hypothetical protein
LNHCVSLIDAGKTEIWMSLGASAMRRPSETPAKPRRNNFRSCVHPVAMRGWRRVCRADMKMPMRFGLMVSSGRVTASPAGRQVRLGPDFLFGGLRGAGWVTGRTETGRLGARGDGGGRYRDRTCDLSRVKGTRYRCANRPTGAEEPAAPYKPLTRKATALPCEGSALPLS